MKRDQLLTFAEISAITYENPTASRDKFAALGYTIVEFFDVDGAEGYLLKGADTHVLSFRGTEVNQKSDVAADLESGKNIEPCGGKVHVGFKREINKLWPAIQAAVADIDTLYVTGHSLGAAMATIAAGRLRAKVIALITFGSPRTGNQQFVNKLTVTHYRVQNNCDDVTKVPLKLMGFAHHGTHMYMNYHGVFKQLTVWQQIKDMIRSRLKAMSKKQHFIGVSDHKIENYIAKLQKSQDSQ